jgi:ferredoxin
LKYIRSHTGQQQCSADASLQLHLLRSAADRQMGNRMCKLTAFDSEEQLYATVSLLPYASLEELDFSSLTLVSAYEHAAACRFYCPDTWQQHVASIAQIHGSSMWLLLPRYMAAACGFYCPDTWQQHVASIAQTALRACPALYAGVG